MNLQPMNLQPTQAESEAAKAVLAVIPARYDSSRFPGKPLVEIQGKPMIQWVWEQVQQCQRVTQTIVATDDNRIFQAVHSFGGQALMTSPDHPSGTDRVWEVAQQFPECDVIVNIQGDEPFMDPVVVDQAIEHSFNHPEADMVTLVTPFQSQQEWLNPNLVKAVLSQSNRALYFSRQSLPYYRDASEKDSSKASLAGYPAESCYRHLGFYLYRSSALAKFTQLDPSFLELAEKLEQLRALEADMRLDALIIESAPIGVDTPEDLERLLLQQEGLHV